MEVSWDGHLRVRVGRYQLWVLVGLPWRRGLAGSQYIGTAYDFGPFVFQRLPRKYLGSGV